MTTTNKATYSYLKSGNGKLVTVVNNNDFNQRPVTFSLRDTKIALKNVKRGKKSYATDEAFNDQVRYFQTIIDEFDEEETG